MRALRSGGTPGSVCKDQIRSREAAAQMSYSAGDQPAEQSSYGSPTHPDWTFREREGKEPFGRRAPLPKWRGIQEGALREKKNEKARKELPEIHGCREEKSPAAESASAGAGGHAPGPSKALEPGRESAPSCRSQAASGEAACVGIREQKSERHFSLFVKLSQSRKKKKNSKEETDHLNVFQNNGLHIFESEGRTDRRTDGGCTEDPRVSPRGSEEDEESLCYLFCERKAKPLPRSPAMLTEFIESSMDRRWSWCLAAYFTV